MPLPNTSHRLAATIRGLPGDVRRLLPGQSCQAIDVEYGQPLPLLAVVQVTREDNGAATTASIRISTGVERGILVDETVLNSAGFQRTVLARSITIVVVNTSNVPVFVKAIVVPMNLTAEPSLFGSSAFGTDLVVDPNIGSSVYTVNSTAAQVFSQLLGIASLGTSIFHSSTGSNAYILFGLGAAGTAAGQFSLRMVPMSYFEIPPEWQGVQMSAIWDGAPVGFLNLTTRV